MKYAELTRRLRKLGCYPTRYRAGSHEIWRNPFVELIRQGELFIASAEFAQGGGAPV